MGMVPPCACCILALRTSIGSDCHLLLHFYPNSRAPGICETPDAIRATWHARRTSRFPPSWVSAGRAIPPSSWVRWPPTRVRRSLGMLNGHMLINVTDSNHRRSSEQACFQFLSMYVVSRIQKCLLRALKTFVGVKTCRSIVVFNGEGVFCILVRPPLPERMD